jgi:uncharacterized protein YuzB (UPF0349 family)
MKIRFCENNENSGVTFKRLRAEYPDLDIKRKKCLKNCGACNSSLFAVVDGITLRGRNGEELYLKLSELLETAGKTLAVS